MVDTWGITETAAATTQQAVTMVAELVTTEAGEDLIITYTEEMGGG